MSRIVLIDAYNAAWRLFGDLGGDLDEARRRLVDRTQAALRVRRLRGGVDKVLLVFDTLPGASRTGLHSRAGKVAWRYVAGSADTAMIEHVRRHEGRPEGHVVVVTNDRELAGRCRQLGARAMGVDTFYAGSSSPPVEGRLLPGRPGPPFTAQDFGLPEGRIDLDDSEL